MDAGQKSCVPSMELKTIATSVAPMRVARPGTCLHAQPQTRPLVSAKGWAGAGVRVGMLRGGGIRLIENKKTNAQVPPIQNTIRFQLFSSFG